MVTRSYAGGPRLQAPREELARRHDDATPAIAHGSLIIRTASKLYRIANPAANKRENIVFNRTHSIRSADARAGANWHALIASIAILILVSGTAFNVGIPLAAQAAVEPVGTIDVPSISST